MTAVLSSLATRGLLSSSPLDDFLDRGDRAGTTANAERVRDLGATMSTFGLLLAVGVVVYLARVHRGTRDETSSLLLVAGLGGVALLTGAVAELAGIQTVFGTGWDDVLSVEVSSPAMLRLLAGLLVVFGLADSAGDDGSGHERSGDEASSDERSDTTRWTPGVESSFGLVGLALGVLSFSFDGHTVTEGPRGLHLVTDIVHVTSGGVWFGGVAALVTIAVLRHRSGGSIAEPVVRFSSVATVALVAVAAAGTVMAIMIVDGVGDLTGTVWGRRLLIKVTAVAAAAAIGAYHHVVTVRRFADPGGPTAAELRRTGTTMVIELLVLCFVVAATGLLVNGSIV